MKICENCGQELMEGVAFCNNCGTKVPEAVQAPVQEVVQEPVYTPTEFVQPMQQEQPKSSPASIILGIIGIAVCWMFALAGHVVSIIGIILGAKEAKRTGKKAGLILSIIGEVCSCLSSLIGIISSLAMMAQFF